MTTLRGNELRTRLRVNELAAPLIEALEAFDRTRAIEAIVRELDASFRDYREELARKGAMEVTAITLYWAGAEIEPWVPSTVMGNVYAGRTRVLDSAGGFEPEPLSILCDALADSEELRDSEVFDGLKELFVLESIEIAREAVASAVQSTAFAALRTARPFEVLAIPGHDRRKLLLVRLD